MGKREKERKMRKQSFLSIQSFDDDHSSNLQIVNSYPWWTHFTLILHFILSFFLFLFISSSRSGWREKRKKIHSFGRSNFFTTLICWWWWWSLFCYFFCFCFGVPFATFEENDEEGEEDESEEKEEGEEDDGHSKERERERERRSLWYSQNTNVSQPFKSHFTEGGEDDRMKEETMMRNRLEGHCLEWETGRERKREKKKWSQEEEDWNDDDRFWWLTSEDLFGRKVAKKVIIWLSSQIKRKRKRKRGMKEFFLCDGKSDEKTREQERTER